jgi:hypothetical protein
MLEDVRGKELNRKLKGEIIRKMIKLEWRRSIPDAFLRPAGKSRPSGSLCGTVAPDNEHAQSSVHFRKK